MFNIRKVERLRDQLNRTRTNHIFHLLITVLTGGLWVVMWVAVGFSNMLTRKRLNRTLDKEYIKRGN